MDHGGIKLTCTGCGDVEGNGHKVLWGVVRVGTSSVFAKFDVTRLLGVLSRPFFAFQPLPTNLATQIEC